MFMMPDKPEKEIAILDARSVYCVIVTYGDRFHFLKQVIDACLKEDVGKIVVVDNNSKSSEKLKELEKTLGDRLKVIYLEKNTGSAGGYKVGIEEAYNDKNCQFMLLLDDDNLPNPGSIHKALHIWHYFRETNELFALSFYRSIFSDYILGIKFGVIPGTYWINSFGNFHIGRAFQKFSRKYSKERLKKKETLYPVIKTILSPYGGLLFHKFIIEKIGFPDERFILYADDLEFTYRIKENNGSIYLCSDLVIQDIHFKEIFNPEENGATIYYIIRNSIFFSKKLIRNYFIFTINAVGWCAYFLLYRQFKLFKNVGLKSYIRRLKLIVKAAWCGIKGNLSEAFFENQKLKL
jgi:GT2 family glycosyltransferase